MRQSELTCQPPAGNLNRIALRIPGIRKSEAVDFMNLAELEPIGGKLLPGGVNVRDRKNNLRRGTPPLARSDRCAVKRQIAAASRQFQPADLRAWDRL